MTERVSKPGVTVHSLAQAEAALAAAGPRGVMLLSAPGAGGFAPDWFLALAAGAARRHPAVPCEVAIDCADAAGSALAALRAGARVVVLDGACPSFAAVAAAAEEAGARLLPARPASLDLGAIDLRRRAGAARLAAWVAMEAPQGSPTPAAS